MEKIKATIFFDRHDNSYYLRFRNNVWSTKYYGEWIDQIEIQPKYFNFSTTKENKWWKKLFMYNKNTLYLKSVYKTSKRDNKNYVDLSFQTIQQIPLIELTLTQEMLKPFKLVIK